MTNSSETVLNQLGQILGPRGLHTDAETIQPWLTDWRGRYTGRAIALAAPASTAELAATVAACHAAGVPVVPQGGNSGMSGGATPDDTGTALLLTTRRMNAIRGIDVGARQAVCEAGVVLQTLHEAAAAEALRFPLTLGGKGSATIGGLISTNAGGTQVLRHGVMRAQVLGLEAVLPDGRVFDALVPLRKDNRGFDLKQLFIGSEGTLGIVTAATLRLLPTIGDRVVVWVGLRSIHDARALLLHCETALGDALEGFEVLPQACLDSVLAFLPDARAPLADQHPWHALIEVAASPEQSSLLRDRTEQALAAALAHDLMTDAVLSASESQAEAFWTLRDAISMAERARGPAMQHDISVPVERMPSFIEDAGREVEAAFPGTRVMGFGHLGDGNIHFHVAAPDKADPATWQADEGPAINRLVHDLVTAWGGSISAEHGIGQSKRAELERLHDPVALDLMRRIKAALDPGELLNPNKLVTLARAGHSA